MLGNLTQVLTETCPVTSVCEVLYRYETDSTTSAAVVSEVAFQWLIAFGLN